MSNQKRLFLLIILPVLFFTSCSQEAYFEDMFGEITVVERESGTTAIELGIVQLDDLLAIDDIDDSDDAEIIEALDFYGEQDMYISLSDLNNVLIEDKKDYEEGIWQYYADNVSNGTYIYRIYEGSTDEDIVSGKLIID